MKADGGEDEQFHYYLINIWKGHFTSGENPTAVRGGGLGCFGDEKNSYFRAKSTPGSSMTPGHYTDRAIAFVA